jgi:1-acyl-sn-glycerol-3-phosphate acyltransferase
MHPVEIKYPRRVIIRKILLFFAKFLLSLLFRLKIEGLEKIPREGPLILAGNHVSALEAMILAAYSPRLVEFLGSGDIPFDPNYAWIAEAYGLIPVNRGNLDRAALRKSIDVLLQKGFLGIFPEGGIWSPAKMEAQTGVALISYKAKAPIIPIGFGGMQGAIASALKLHRPILTMRVGDIIQPLTINKGDDHKKRLQALANEILNAIDLLLPEDERQGAQSVRNEVFSLDITITKQNGNILSQEPFDLGLGSAYAHFMFTPVLQDVLVRNLKLPIKPLRNTDPIEDLLSFSAALDSILQYLDLNPGFFTYRFGMEEGLKIKQALEKLSILSKWAHQEEYNLHLVPIMYTIDTKGDPPSISLGGKHPGSMA